MTGEGKGKRMGPEDVARMNELRDKGLSNAQIAIELGVSDNTVARYLGRQKTGSRTPYGALKTHADGESFALEGAPMVTTDEFLPCSKLAELEEAGIKIAKPVRKKPPVLLLEKEEWTKSLKGRDYSYKLISDGQDILCWIRETLTGDELVVNAENLSCLVQELLALNNYIPQK